MSADTATTPSSQPNAGTATLIIDPVCGMAVPPYKVAAHHQHDGQAFDFCSVACRDKFRENPAQYLKTPTAVGTGLLARLRRFILGD